MIAIHDQHKHRMRVHSKIHSYTKLQHLHINHVAFPLEKSLNFYCYVHSVRLLASALGYRSGDVYHSASDYLATVSEHAL